MARPQTVSDEQIRQAARAVFLEHGPGAPVKQIAAHLGVSHAALFQRVGSKEVLMRLALGPQRSPIPRRLQEPPPSEGAKGCLTKALLELLANLRQIIPGLIVLRGAGIELETALEADQLPPPVAVRRALTRWLRRADASGVIRVSKPKGVAEGVLGAIEARAFNAYLGGSAYVKGSDKRFIADLLAALVR